MRAAIEVEGAGGASLWRLTNDPLSAVCPAETARAQQLAAEVGNAKQAEKVRTAALPLLPAAVCAALRPHATPQGACVGRWGYCRVPKPCQVCLLSHAVTCCHDKFRAYGMLSSAHNGMHTWFI
jgi:hypothetical protein